MGTSLSRRQFLATGAALGAATLLPGTANAGTNQPHGSGPRWDRFLILIELDGGNDGLNTVIPYNIGEYHDRRPNLHYTPSELSGTMLTGATGAYVTNKGGVSANQSFALNKKMTHLMAAWNPALVDANKHDLAIVLGVGYNEPNLSHFRSMDIWNGGSAQNQFPSDNWLGRLYGQTAVATTMPGDLTAHGVLLSRYSSNPLRRGGIRYLAMSNPKEFVQRSYSVPDTDPAVATSIHYQHLLTTQREVFRASGTVRTALMTANTVSPDEGTDYDYTPADVTGPGTSWPNPDVAGHDFEKRCRSIAEMIATNANADTSKRLKIPVYKVQLGGFDNHTAQKTKHESLLEQLSSGMASIRAALKKFPGLWERTLIMTYSEFGRRVEENASLGTDHGTANCHMLMGGGIKGGFYGAQPGLWKESWSSQNDDLDDRGNLVNTVDFRNLYATAATWLGLPFASDAYMGSATALDCFA